MRSIKIDFVSLLFLLTGVSAICKNFGANCPENAPCCLQGWCSNDSRYCAVGCEPENSFKPASCYPQPKCVSFKEEFNQPKIATLSNFTGDPTVADWTSDFLPDHSTIENGNLILNMPLGQQNNEFGRVQGFGATVSSVRWLDYGVVNARIKTASTSPGIVSSFITRNLFGDEIDFEWVGKNSREIQQNFYYNNVLNYTNARFSVIEADTSADYHIYTIDWQPDYIRWSVDGQELRTVNRQDTWDPELKAFKFPYRPQRVQFSIWDAGQASDGTSEWAGGRTDWSDANRVYKMYIDWVDVQCKYSGNETAPWPGPGYDKPTINPNATVPHTDMPGSNRHDDGLSKPSAADRIATSILSPYTLFLIFTLMLSYY
ncbi:putative glycosidase CRH2 [Basidiobolus ranarum]|uniref:Glycosidase CRH2 n=1 Tax=Basidiobolus ranarum TaxID=34480 RepID=A0ABR2WQQ1_9FUNG